MQDEGLHEIQLNGKQLVFVFMAATVVAVVIFLCGVMVGRGVPVQRAILAANAPEQPAIDPTAAVQPPPAPVANTGMALVTAGETLTYTERLESPEPPDESLQPAVEPAAFAEPPAARPRARDVVRTVPVADAAAPAAAGAPSLAEPAGNGFAVQVAAVRQRAEAEIVARRLSAKGYPAFVTTAGPNVFRVRVGKYDDRREAEAVAGRLEREERFRPWITR